MSNILRKPYVDKDSFHEWVLACCDTLKRNEDKIFNMTRDRTTYIDITFPIRVDEIPTMLINIEKVIQNEEQITVVIKNVDRDKESENNEN